MTLLTAGVKKSYIKAILEPLVPCLARIYWTLMVHLRLRLRVIRNKPECWCYFLACFWCRQFVRRYLEQRATDVHCTAKHLIWLSRHNGPVSHDAVIP